MNYSEYSKLALAMLRSRGGPCSIIHEEKTYDRESHSNRVERKVLRGHAVITGYSEGAVDGTSIKKGDARILFSMPSYVKGHPSDNDVAVIGDMSFTVKHVDPKSPNGVQVILYEIQGRS